MLRTLLFSLIGLLAAARAPAQKLLHQKAPAINLATSFRDGKKIHYTIPKGKFLLVEFWATWCTPCVRYIPHLNELAQEFNGRIQFISISDEAADKVSGFLAAHPIAGIVGLDEGGKTFKAFGIKGRPTTFIINDKGIIVFAGYPAGLTSEKLSLLLDGHQIEEKESEPGKGRLGRWGGGEDPVVTGSFDMSQMGYRRYEVLRKSVDASGGTGWKNWNGEVGITLLSVTRRDIIAFVHDLPSPQRVLDLLPDSADTWDLIFLRKTGYEMARAKKDVEKMVEETFAAHIGQHTRETAVLVPAYDAAKLIDATQVPDNDPNLKSYELLSEVCAGIERKTGDIIECPPGADGLYVDVFELGDKYYRFTGSELKNWISTKYGVLFNKKMKLVTFKTIVPN